MTEFETVIGLETHIQLNTASKIFCRCKADSWGELPNTNICPVCCGLPGVLPVLNKAVVEKAVLLAGAMHSEIRSRSFFARKNYFYPDLPKGYQISQYDEPVGRGGFFSIELKDGEVRQVRIHKMHLEEDAGKTRLIAGRRYIDMNRCGVPLIEMVTEPDLRSADEAAAYLAQLRRLLRWLGVSEGNMERAQLRCDANVSIRPRGADYLNPKTEIKNVNSIEAVREAIRAEEKRQREEMESGRQVKPWTLEWDEDTSTLKKMRSKETEADYRYFREPDLLPLLVPEEMRKRVLLDLPELPSARRDRFLAQYELPTYDAGLLTESRRLADFFEDTAHAYAGEPKKIANWILNDLARLQKEKGGEIESLGVSPAHLAELIALVDAGTVTVPVAKRLLEKLIGSAESPRELVAKEGLAEISGEEALLSLCREVVAENADSVEQYRKGKTTLLQFFIGQAMKKSRGKANPQQVGKILEELLAQE